MGIKEMIIRQAASALINAIPPDALAKGADQLLDLVEDMVENSDTKVDDAVVLPLIKLIRTSFQIPDNDVAALPKE